MQQCTNTGKEEGCNMDVNNTGFQILKSALKVFHEDMHWTCILEKKHNVIWEVKLNVNISLFLYKKILGKWFKGTLNLGTLTIATDPVILCLKRCKHLAYQYIICSTSIYINCNHPIRTVYLL